MTENEAIDSLMQHFVHRTNEFFRENKAEEIEQGQLANHFARWLYVKEVLQPQPFKTANGVVAQHFNAEQVTDDNSVTMAHLKLFKDHGVGLLWMAELFVNPGMAMPDELRESMVQVLRFHADRLESRELDERLKQVYKTTTGAA